MPLTLIKFAVQRAAVIKALFFKGGASRLRSRDQVPKGIKDAARGFTAGWHNTQGHQVQIAVGIHRKRHGRKRAYHLIVQRIHAQGRAIHTKLPKLWRCALIQHKEPPITIKGKLSRQPKANPMLLPLPRCRKTMHRPIRPIRHIESPLHIADSGIGFPRICQLHSGWRLPMAAQCKTAQRKDTHAMIAAVADKEVAATDGDAVRRKHLMRPCPLPCNTWHLFKATAAGVKTLKGRPAAVQQKDAAIRRQRDMAGQDQAPKGAARLGHRALTLP